jgi:LemA protein
MGRTTVIVLVIIGILAIGAISIFSWVKGTYNSLVAMDEGVKTAWSEVDNQLQRRSDLIPNLVETVKGYAKQERDVFIEVTEARSKVAGASNVQETIEANNQLSSALSRLLVVVERYPDLKSNENFKALQFELAGTENRLATARRRYNESVRTLNTKVRSFPANLIAGQFNFEKAPLFEAPEEARELPQVNFTDEG